MNVAYLTFICALRSAFFLQTLSSCVVLDDDSADETATGASTATTATKPKSQSNLVAATTLDPSDSSHAQYASPRSATGNSQGFSDAGICNPAFNFDDDEENEGIDERALSNFHTIEESVSEMEEDVVPTLASQNSSVTVSHSRTATSRTESKGKESSDANKSKRPAVNGKANKNTDVEVRKDQPHKISRRDSQNKRNKSIPVDEFGDGGDTDEDAASLSMSTTVSDASTVVPGEGVHGGYSSAKDKKNKVVGSENHGVSQPAVIRRASVKSQKQSKLASGEGNVKIVEIKSRDVVQGILRMEPKLGASLGAKDHVAIVKVPVALSQKPQKQKSHSSSVNVNNARQSASSNRSVRGSGSSQELRDGNSKKVRIRVQFQVFLPCSGW
jgi:hypothetical protein